MTITRISSGAPWEALVGYCRAVVAPPFVFVSGTVGRNPDTGELPVDVESQCANALTIIGRALATAGARSFRTLLAANACRIRRSPAGQHGDLRRSARSGDEDRDRGNGGAAGVLKGKEASGGQGLSSCTCFRCWPR